MYIKRILYPVTTLGPGRRIGIWVAGCSRACQGCISPDLQSRKNAADLNVDRILSMCSRLSGKFDGVTISGGEPMEQPTALAELVIKLRQQYTEDIIVYTGYQLEELQKQKDAVYRSILENIAVLIDGPYIDELNDGVGLRGSANQRIHILRNAGDYTELATQKRSLQTFVYENKILLIGIQ